TLTGVAVVWVYVLIVLEFSICAPHKCSVPAVARLYTNTCTELADGPIVPVTKKRCQLEVIGNAELTMTAPLWSSISKFAELEPEGVFTQQLKVKVWFATGMGGVTFCLI